MLLVRCARKDFDPPIYRINMGSVKSASDWCSCKKTSDAKSRWRLPCLFLTEASRLRNGFASIGSWFSKILKNEKRLRELAFWFIIYGTILVGLSFELSLFMGFQSFPLSFARCLAIVGLGFWFFGWLIAIIVLVFSS